MSIWDWILSWFMPKNKVLSYDVESSTLHHIDSDSSIDIDVVLL